MASIAGASWGLFIGENVVLSENRTWIIEKFGDNMYHNIYNTLSTISCTGIAYAFFKYRNSAAIMTARPGIAALFKCSGLLLASQIVPSIRNPIKGGDSKTR